VLEYSWQPYWPMSWLRVGHGLDSSMDWIAFDMGQQNGPMYNSVLTTLKNKHGKKEK